MIDLFYMPGAASLAPHIVLEETGAEYRLIRTQRTPTVDPPELLDVNPHGRIPAMRIGDLNMYESAACVMHLADLYPAAGLAPAVGTPERALYYRWLMFLTNTVQPALIAWFGADRVATPEGEAAVKAKAVETLASLRGHVDGELARTGPYLLGSSYSAADIFLFMLTRWTRNMDAKWWDGEHLGPHFRSIRERPAVQRVWEQEGLDG